MEDLIQLEKEINEERYWFRRAQLISKYHALKYAERSAKRGERWTLSDTAKQLTVSIGYVSESISLADKPELSKFSRAIALKVLRRNGK